MYIMCYAMLVDRFKPQVGALYISIIIIIAAQLSTYAVSALPKVWLLARLWKQSRVQTRT